MPAILEPEHFADWLDPNVLNAQQAAALLQPAPDDSLDVFEISSLVNNYPNNGADVQHSHCRGICFRQTLKFYFAGAVCPIAG